MLNTLIELYNTFTSTVIDVLPIISLIFFFQIFVLKQKVPHIQRVVLGFVYVIVGLSFFLLGLEKALFPLGEAMASQLASPEFLEVESLENVDWSSYYWLYIFAAAIGFSTTIAEPSLIAVAIKASEVTGGAISKNNLRIIVAIGVSIALVLGTHRIIIGTPLHLYIIASYVVVIIQTIFAPKNMIPLAYDSGGVTTSTVTVPIVAALGFGLSSIIPGRNPAIDGFGIIALACLFPIITVLAYYIFINTFSKIKLN